MKTKAKPCKSLLCPLRYPPNAVLFHDRQAKLRGSCGNLTQIANSRAPRSCIVLACRVDGCLGLCPPAEEFFQEWNNLVHGGTVSWHKASWKPTLRTHFVNEEREAQGYVCEVRCQKTGPPSKNYANDPVFLITRNLHLWLPLVYYLVNNPWEKHLTRALIRPLVFR